MAIKGFENITFELTPKEQNEIVPAMVKALEKKVGKENAVTNKQMIDGLKTWNLKTNAPRIRKMIQYIRITGTIERLIATSKGYYISNDPKELINYIESLNQRADSISLLAKQLDYQTKKIL